MKQAAEHVKELRKEKKQVSSIKQMSEEAWGEYRRHTHAVRRMRQRAKAMVKATQVGLDNVKPRELRKRCHDVLQVLKEQQHSRDRERAKSVDVKTFEAAQAAATLVNLAEPDPTLSAEAETAQAVAVPTLPLQCTPAEMAYVLRSKKVVHTVVSGDNDKPEEEEDEHGFLLEEVELAKRYIRTKLCGREAHGRYNNNSRLTWCELAVLVKAKKQVPATIETILRGLGFREKELTDLVPTRFTLARNCTDMSLICELQVSEFLQDAKSVSAGTDGTDRGQGEMNALVLHKEGKEVGDKPQSMLAGLTACHAKTAEATIEALETKFGHLSQTAKAFNKPNADDINISIITKGRGGGGIMSDHKFGETKAIDLAEMASMSHLRKFFGPERC
jgi:hypothetical protein